VVLLQRRVRQGSGIPAKITSSFDCKDMSPPNPWRLSVAPMIDWTDRHCRYFHRLLSQNARLYTEMITTGALLHGDVARHLRFNAEEHPVALQLGGSEPAERGPFARRGG
jgi:tRNA-dihydrouridine synthase A